MSLGNNNGYFTDRDEIFEDAIISYVANKYVEEKSKEIEQEAGELNLEAEMPKEREYKKIINKLYKKEQRRKKSIPTVKMVYVYKAAMVVAILFIVFSASMVTVPAMREVVLDFLIERSDIDTEIRKDVPENESMANEEIKKEVHDVGLKEEYSLTYVPEGFSAFSLNKDSLGKSMDYYDSNSNMISFTQIDDDSIVNVDTENARVYNYDINGQGALVSVKEDDGTVVITWSAGKYFISICGVGVSEEEMLKVADGVKKIK